MGILTLIVAADASEAEEIGESLSPADDWNSVAQHDIDIPRLALLHSLLTGDLFDDAMALCEPIYISPETGNYVIHVPDFLAERLADLDEDALEAVAGELAATEEYELAQADPEALHEWLCALAELARGARREGQDLFAWLHPNGR